MFTMSRIGCTARRTWICSLCAYLVQGLHGSHADGKLSRGNWKDCVFSSRKDVTGCMWFVDSLLLSVDWECKWNREKKRRNSRWKTPHTYIHTYLCLNMYNDRRCFCCMQTIVEKKTVQGDLLSCGRLLDKLIDHWCQHWSNLSDTSVDTTCFVFSASARYMYTYLCRLADYFWIRRTLLLYWLVW